MPLKEYSFLLKLMHSAARKAEVKIMRDFVSLDGLNISIKPNNEPVTNTDKISEEIIYNELTKKININNFSFIMEEGGIVGSQDAEFCFIIDPIDGTSNFIHGIPYFCTSIALRHNNKIVAGLIHSPATKETFHATIGDGAKYIDINSNTYKLKINTNKNNSKNIMLATSGISKNLNSFTDNLIKQNIHIRNMGSIALDIAYLASKKFDAVLYGKSKLWDYAAGYIIAKESGCIITTCKKEREIKDGEDGIIGAVSEDLHKIIYNEYILEK